MEQLTTITLSGRRPVPKDLALLEAPVFASRSLPQQNELVGWVEGVVTRNRARIVFFVVRLEREPERSGRRVLIPLAALDPAAIEEGANASLVVTWTADQVTAQPDFKDEVPPPQNPDDSGVVLAGRWLPIASTRVPPGRGLDHRHAWRKRLVWGAASALLGAVVALVAGGGAAMAVGAALFFGLGGALAGSMYGYSRDSATDASAFDEADPDPEITALVGRLEWALQRRQSYGRGMFRIRTLRPDLYRSMDGGCVPRISRTELRHFARH